MHHFVDMLKLYKYGKSFKFSSFELFPRFRSRSLLRNKTFYYNNPKSRGIHSCSFNMKDLSLYTLPNNQPIINLDCEEAFNGLADKEKLYAHYLSQASWHGGLIAFVQTSPEAPLIFALLHKVFLAESISDIKKTALDNGVAEDEFTAFLVYANGIFGNGGNYKSFGDSKIIPNMTKDKFELIIKKSKAYQKNPIEIQSLLNKMLDIAYSLEGKLISLGIGDKGITTYFSSNCTEEDGNRVTRYLQKQKFEAWNTRCFKRSPNSGQKCKAVYEIRVASILTDSDPKLLPEDEIFEEYLFQFTRGDYNILLKPLVENLEKAKEHALNDTEVKMIEKYIDYFTTGSLEAHKEGSNYWIKDKGPVIESYIGFIENYRDPLGQRAEFEGFVAMVNRDMSKKFGALVANAEKFLIKLPWPQDYEKDKFLKPDFTSLDVLTFTGSGIPAGINIPNYDSIRQNEGFKNVSLGNVISGNLKQDVLPFLSEEDQALIHKYRIPSFEVQVGLHELLGHGSGKLFKKTKEGLNYDPKKILDPETKRPLAEIIVPTYYEEGQTYDSVFGQLGSAYEECRAEGVGLYLSLEKEIVKIFDELDSEIEDIIYVNWLMLIWSGCCKALEMYEPSTKSWLQAHSQARYVLMRVCLEAGEDFIKLVESEPGKNLHLTLDRTKLNSVGKKAVGDFLVKLQFYKSTANIEKAREMFNKYSEVPEDGPHPWAKWRDIILAHKQPRKIFVQANTFVSDSGNVQFKSYEPSFEGMIQSWLERFPDDNVSNNLIKLCEKDSENFRY